jgi:hypothetical protein
MTISKVRKGQDKHPASPMTGGVLLGVTNNFLGYNKVRAKTQLIHGLVEFYRVWLLISKLRLGQG